MSDTVDLQALSDLATPWFLRVAVTLRLPELINDGVDDVERLADKTGATRDGVWAVLTHLSERGVFVRVEPGRFTCGPCRNGSSITWAPRPARQSWS